MNAKKIINSLKIEEADYGKLLGIDSNGNLKLISPTPSYIPLTAGTVSLTNDNIATTTTYTYNIADFEGIGLIPANITTLFIRTKLSQNWDEYNLKSVSVTFPDGTHNAIHVFDRSLVSGPDVAESQQFQIPVPIKFGQTTFEITVNIPGGSTTNSVSIVAALQHEL